MIKCILLNKNKEYLLWKENVLNVEQECTEQEKK